MFLENPFNTVNGIWGYQPLVKEKFVKNPGKSNEFKFYQVLSKFSLTAFKLIFETFSPLEACLVTIVGGLVNKKFTIFKVFNTYFSSAIKENHNFNTIFSTNRQNWNIHFSNFFFIFQKYLCTNFQVKWSKDEEGVAFWRSFFLKFVSRYYFFKSLVDFSNHGELETPQALFGTWKDRSIRYVRMKEKKRQDFSHYPLKLYICIAILSCVNSSIGLSEELSVSAQCSFKSKIPAKRMR